MKKYIKALSVLLWFLLLTVVVYATATTASTRKSIKLPWQWTPAWHYDIAHNVWTISLPENRFTCVSGTCNNVQSNNGVVSDSVTGLQWQSWYPASTYTWQLSKDYCTNLTLWWYTDWRLPAFKELESIVALNVSNPSIDTSYFSSASNRYWSSTTHALYTTFKWVLDFNNGRWTYADTTYYVRCVR